jgi:two-component system invasion response regulator UvrY
MHREEHYALHALNAGASGFLTKECDSEVLVAAMRKLAATGVHVSDEVAELLVRDYVQKTHDAAHVAGTPLVWPAKWDVTTAAT